MSLTSQVPDDSTWTNAAGYCRLIRVMPTPRLPRDVRAKFLNSGSVTLARRLFVQGAALNRFPAPLSRTSALPGRVLPCLPGFSLNEVEAGEIENPNLLAIRIDQPVPLQLG